MAKQKGTWDISIEINGKEVKNNLSSVGKEVGKLNADLKKLTPGTDAFIKKSTELKKARKQYSDIKSEINGTNISLEEAKGHFSNVFEGFLSGDIKQVQSGLRGVIGNLKGITKAALAFIATPIGIAITGLMAIGLATKEWVQFNLRVEEANNLVKELTNTAGGSVDAIRIRAEVLKDTFGVELKESINSAKSLVEGFGVSYDAAFDLIEEGAVKGKLKNEEFLNTIKEYPRLFKNGGFSAKEFVDIVNAGIDLSIYKDKLPDAIKEFVLSITEQTPAAKLALENAFGKEFTGKLFKNIKDGSLGPKEALKNIALEAQKIGLNSQQAQLLTADLFKGAGEDAGGAIKIFEAVNTALNGQQKPLTETQKLTQKQLDLNKELSGVFTQVFASSSNAFGNLIKNGKIFATEILLKILKGGVGVYNWLIDLNNESALFSAILSTLGSAASIPFSIIGKILSNAVTGFKGLGTIIEGIFTLDTDKIASGFKTAVSAIPNLIKGIKKEVTTDINDIYAAFQGKNKGEKIDLKAFLSTETKETTTEKVGGNSNGVLTPEDQKILDSKKKLAKFIADFDADQELQKELLKVDKKDREEEEEILRLEMKFQKMAEDAGFETVVAAGLEDAKLAAIKEVKDKYDVKEADDKKKKLKKLEDLEVAHNKALLKADTDLENAKANLQASGFYLLQSFFGRKTALYKLIFGLEKAMAISGILVDTSKSLATITAATAAANAQALAAAPLTGGLPFIAINTALGAKQALITKINAGVQIANIAGAAIQGFYDGGDTGDKAIAYDRFGKVTGVVHANEWVAPEIMTSNPKYAETFSYLEAERKSLTKGYFNGGATSKNTADSFSNEEFEPESTTSNSEVLLQLTATTNRLNNLLAAGIKANISFGYPELKDLKILEEEAANANNYGKIKP